MLRYFLTRQFLLFVFVGSSAAFLHWLARIVLSIWMPFWLAVFLAYLVGMLVAFALNKLYVFPLSAKSTIDQAKGFLATNLFFLPVVWGAALIFNTLFESLAFTSYNEAIAHGLAVSIPMLATFIIYKFLAFKDI